MNIEDKYIRMMGKKIYSKELDKHGNICSIEILFGLNGITPIMRAYFDSFDPNAIICLEDFINGKVKFEIPTGLPIFDEMYEKSVKDAKFIFGEKYSDDMIIRYERTNWDEMREQQKTRNKQLLSTDLVSLTDISVDVFYKDFYIQDLYLKYKNGALTEIEMLYAIVNYLCCENKQLADKNLEYFSKYDLIKTI